MTISQRDHVLDANAALQRTGGDAQLLGELAGLFLGEYPGQLAALLAALERGDSKEVNRSAHMLKGSAAHFGATAAVHALLALERAGRNQDLSGCAPVSSELEQVLALLRVELAALAGLAP